MYNPSDHKPQNIPFGITDLPLNAKSLYYDKIKFLYRAFLSVSECQNYFDDEFKDPTFECIVNSTGVFQSDGTIVGGVNDAYWFRDSVTLVLKLADVDLSNYYDKNEIDQRFDELPEVAKTGSYLDLEDLPKKTALTTPTINSASVYIEETIGSDIIFVVADKLIYYLGDGVTHNNSNGIFVFDVPFYTNSSKVWAYYTKSSTPPIPPTNWDDSLVWNDSLVWVD